MQPCLLRRTSVFLQAVIVLMGIAVLTALLYEPHLEGVNRNAMSLADIYLDDRFLAYVYTASIAFFVALYQAFVLLRHIGKENVFSMDSVKALRTIKYCGIMLCSFVAGGAFFLFVIERGKSDDIAGGVAMCALTGLASLVLTTGAAVFERVVEKGRSQQSLS